ncbi:hypothetical protein VEV11M_43890 (plasmid) [Escherichia coli]|nr:hypothetical protein VEV11M_43890 [Escherichia coli]
MPQFKAINLVEGRRETVVAALRPRLGRLSRDGITRRGTDRPIEETPFGAWLDDEARRTRRRSISQQAGLTVGSAC